MEKVAETPNDVTRGAGGVIPGTLCALAQNVLNRSKSALRPMSRLRFAGCPDIELLLARIEPHHHHMMYCCPCRTTRNPVVGLRIVSMYRLRKN